MPRILLALFLLLALFPLARAQETEQAVTWVGSVELPDGSSLDFSVELKHDSGTISIPLQQVLDLPLDGVAVSDKKLVFSIALAGAEWSLDLAQDGQSATGVLKQGAELKTTMKRLAPGEHAQKTLRRPQEPKTPFPYESVEVKFENKEAHAKLAGTLTLPKGAGPFPCAVLVTGSGPQDRDESLMGHRPFLVIADHLTRAGIAVLRYDDRGVAKSTGKFSKATTEDFANDALAAVAFLKTRPEIDAKRIGIIGHSEGGIVAPICAARSQDVAFIVLLAGTGMRGAELMPLQSKLINIASGMAADKAQAEAHDTAEIYAKLVAGASDAELKECIRAMALRQMKSAPEMKDLSEEALAKKADAVVAEQAPELLSPWFRCFLALDPRTNLLHVTCPVLALNGEKDLQVPPKENLALIRSALEEGGNKDVTIRELPGLNHLFQTCTTGAPAEYARIEETFAPAALEVLASWIRKHTGLE
ncbi:MAG: alpha/beta fold hydrolase [Planctomycetes bacterium]|nr:alpha/beta fold hydrolase [Planctomycetota bacterium]